MTPRTLDRLGHGVALLALLVIGLRPSRVRLVDPTIAVIRAPGATMAEARAVAESLGGVRVFDGIGGELPTEARDLHIVGWGLDAGELRQVRDRAVVLHPWTLPDGVRSVAWSDGVRLGDPVEVRVTARVARRSILTLVAESGEADSVALPAGAITTAALRHVPRATGAARYILRVGPVADTFSVYVAPSRPASAILLASAPSREWSDLRDWLAAQGGAVTLRSDISRDRTRLDRANVPAAARSPLDRATLAQTALVITDGRTLARLGAAERRTLTAAVQSGLGLIVILDSAARDARLIGRGERAELVPWRTTPVADLEERQVRPRTHGLQISATPIMAEPALVTSERLGSSVLLDDGQGGALAMVATSGAGRVVGSVVTGAGRWIRGGEPEAFAAYWSALVRAAARPDPIEQRWEFGGGPIVVDAEVALGHRGPPLSASRAGDDTLRHAVDPLVPGRSLLHWWPRSAGWDAIDDVKVWVGGERSWGSWRAAERRRVTEEWIGAQRGIPAPGGAVPVRVPWPLWPFFLLFVAAVGWLWRVRA